jgi:hypothetical protein
MTVGNPHVHFILYNGAHDVQGGFNASTTLLMEQTRNHYRNMVSGVAGGNNAMRRGYPCATVAALQARVQSFVLLSILLAFDVILAAAVIPSIRRTEAGKDKILKVRWRLLVRAAPVCTNPGRAGVACRYSWTCPSSWCDT